MKKAAAAVGVWLAVMAGFYLLFSYISWEYDWLRPWDWTERERGASVFVGLFAGIGAMLIGMWLPRGWRY